jgi:hypothetical protein
MAQDVDVATIKIILAAEVRQSTEEEPALPHSLLEALDEPVEKSLFVLF